MRSCKVWLTIGMLSVLLLTGCNGSDPSSTTGEATSQTTVAKTPEPPPKNDKLAVLFYRGDGAFASAVRDGIGSAAEEYNVEVEIMAADVDNAAEQVTLLENAVAERFRGICLCPLGPEVEEPLKAAAEAKIPVVLFGGELPSEVKVVSCAATDQFHAGRSIAEFLQDQLNEDAKVLLVDCKSDAQSAARAGGFAYAAEKELKKFEVISVECGEDTSAAVAAQLEEHDDVAAIVAFNVHSTRAVLELMEGDDAPEAIVCGYGSWEGTAAAIEEGKLAATMLEDPYMIGYSCVMAMANHLAAEDVGEFITTGEHVVSSDNLDDPNTQRLLESNR